MFLLASTEEKNPHTTNSKLRTSEMGFLKIFKNNSLFFTEKSRLTMVVSFVSCCNILKRDNVT